MVIKTQNINGLEYAPSRITMQEGNIDWLTNTPFPMKERGFLFLIMLPVRAVISRASGLHTNGYIT